MTQAICLNLKFKHSNEKKKIYETPTSSNSLKQEMSLQIFKTVTKTWYQRKATNAH